MFFACSRWLPSRSAADGEQQCSRDCGFGFGPPQRPCSALFGSRGSGQRDPSFAWEATLTWINIRATGTGASQDITLTEAKAIDQLFLFADGALQQPGSKYAISGTTLTTTQPSGADLLVRYLGTALEPPVNWVAPSISGLAEVDQALAATTGLWTGLPSPTFAYQWLRNSTSIAGATSNNYTLVAADVGASIKCSVTAANSAGTAVAGSNTLGPIGASALSTPTLTNYSALGAAPVVLQMSASGYVAGLRGQLQIASDAAFASVSQNIVFFIDGDSWARLDEGIGLVTPSGTYYARVRILRDNESGSTSVNGSTYDASAWSTTFSDTIIVSVAQWSSTTGSDKSQYLTPSNGNLTLATNANVNANCGCRATLTVTGKRYFETTVNGHGTQSNGTIAIGVTDDSLALGPATFPAPGSGGSGANWRLKSGSAATTVFRNGSSAAGSSLSTALADGDKLGISFDTAANTVKLSHKPGSGSWYDVQTLTLSSQIPANWRAYGAGFGAGDQWTTNFGGSAFDRALETGYQMYG